MKKVHVECKPDELLVSKLGFDESLIIHSSGKSRILNKLSKSSNSLAMIDEDPTGPKHPYESHFKVTTEEHGIRLLIDIKGNRAAELKVKLEDWILSSCVISNINPEDFNLSSDPKRLHKEINHKLDNFGNLIDALLEVNNPSLATLKSWLQ